MNSDTIVRCVSESFIKPNIENVRESKQAYILTPWDLRLLSSHYAQLGLFFKKPQPQTFSFHQIVESLKDSLALTLVRFYPLLGQLTTQIDHDQRKCVVLADYNKGPGAHFVHATLDVTLSDILSPTYTPPILSSLFDGHDDTVVNFDGLSRPLISVQVIELLDGVFISSSINHAVVDGVTLENFWNTWSEIHSSNMTTLSSLISPPPIIGKPCLEHAFSYTTSPDEIVTRYKSPLEMKSRVFYISTEAMMFIKTRANNEISNTKITISFFQALSALIWRALVRAMRLSPHEVTTCCLAINVRKRFEPPLPQEYFGNILDSIVATTTVDQLLKQNLGWTASLLNEYILNYDSKVATGFVNRWLEKPFFVDSNKVAAQNWVRIGGSPTFNRYANKFGILGTPVAIRAGFGNKFPGQVNMFRGFEGGASVDVEISLMPEVMATLESDQEFMDVVCLSNAQL